MSVFKAEDTYALENVLPEPLKWIEFRKHLARYVPLVRGTSTAYRECFIDDLTRLNVPYDAMRQAFEDAGMIARWDLFVSEVNIANK